MIHLEGAGAGEREADCNNQQLLSFSLLLLLDIHSLFYYKVARSVEIWSSANRKLDRLQIALALLVTAQCNVFLALLHIPSLVPDNPSSFHN